MNSQLILKRLMDIQINSNILHAGHGRIIIEQMHH